MLVYALQSSPRLIFVLDFISSEIFNQKILLTSNLQEFIHYKGSKINYSTATVSPNEFWIYSIDLLFETGTRKQTIQCFECDGGKAFFQTKSGDFGFDIFAGIFYLLSRYEEYLPYKKDKYGRYAHTNAVAFKESFLHLPLVNIWLINFKRALSQTYADLQFRNRAFSLQPTYDIDIAWSYRNKGWWRNTGGLLKSVITLDWFAFRERLEVLAKKKRDPFDSYDWLDTIHTRLGLKAIYFFLMAFKRKRYDKNISPLKKELQELITHHEKFYITGIHPSWQSGDDNSLLEREIKQLEALVGHEIVHSRQHYLRFALPVTYQKLLTKGITNDYSMGYGTVNGFRASVASSYYWYDLQRESTTSLRIHPFCFMDASAYYELRMSPYEALEQLRKFYKTIREVNGLMITLWHNNFLGTDRGFSGWREIYEIFLKESMVEY